MKIATIVGARPQFIKAAVVSRALRQTGHHEVLIHTGQHYDRNMSDVFFDELELPEPDFNLGIGSGPHGQQTGRMLEAVEAVFVKTRPDWVLVYGDTNSTLAGALAASKLHLPLAHVEAGLRSFNRRMPEEINRVLTDQLSTLLFVPTDRAVRNLADEGICGARVQIVGDVMYDATLSYAAKLDPKRLARWNDGADFVLATIHRAENTDDARRLGIIVEALGEVARDCQVVWPVHPRTASRLAGIEVPPGLKLVPPVGYLDMMVLEKNARAILTDSGGVQKEAYFHRVPCVTVRDETEWTELVEAGWNTLAPPHSAGEIARQVRKALEPAERAWLPLYGEGDAAPKIVAGLQRG